jgi:glycosyltransferase involved in cell wall biosynthesis
MAAILQDRYDVTYIFNNDVQLSDFKDWFDIDLTPSAMKIIKIPFFEERGCYTPNESMVVNEVENPFDIISWESLNYDIFINANMLGKVNPLSAVSLFVCHFPDQEKQNFFQVDRYEHLIVNSDYTGDWVKKRWQLTPSDKLYPPVNMYNPDSRPDEKHNIILSVSRFEVSGSKKQIELVRAFSEMCVDYPIQMRGWKLVLVGGSTPENMYLEAIKDAVAQAQCPIELSVNAAVSDIKEYYRAAAIFWHACGLEEIQPERVEHFGMTTVEAMQNYCVPVVIDGGGQKEIVEHQYSGYRFSSLDDLKMFSLTLIGDEGRRKTMAECAFERSHLFSKDVFKIKFEKLLAQVELELSGKDSLPGGH